MTWRWFVGMVLAIVASCGGPKTRIVGRLVDAETGKPVMRGQLWVHAFRDDVKAQSTAEPDPERSDFELEVPAGGSSVRIVAGNKPDLYQRFEQTYALSGDRLDVEIRLVPTHWVRLHGRILWRDGNRLRPVSEGDGNVNHALIGLGHHMIHAASTENYSVRVPRELVRITKVDTSCSLAPREIDLRGTTEADRELDLILE